MKKKKEVEFKFGPNDKLTSKEKGLFRKTKPWIDFRNSFLKGGTCVLCGCSTRLTAHHKHLNDSASSYTNLDPERFAVLCQSCHRFVHLKQRSLDRKKNPPTPDARLGEIIKELIILTED